MRFIKQTNGTYVAYMTNGMAILTPNKHNSARWDIVVGENDEIVYQHINAPSLTAAIKIAGGEAAYAVV